MVGGGGAVVRRPRLYGAGAAVNVAPFPASSEESTNSVCFVCFRYKAVTAGDTGWRFGIGCSIGDTDTEPKPQISARYRCRVLVSV